jgi:hypothetical protein
MVLACRNAHLAILLRVSGLPIFLVLNACFIPSPVVAIKLPRRCVGNSGRILGYGDVTGNAYELCGILFLEIDKKKGK